MFVYVFRSTGKTGTPLQWLELHADSSGNLTPVDLTGKGGVGANINGATLAVTHVILGVPYFFYFIGSRFKLDDSALQDVAQVLEQRDYVRPWTFQASPKPPAKPDPDLNFAPQSIEFGGQTSSTGCVGVIEAQTIALGLHRRYELALDALTTYRGPSDDYLDQSLRNVLSLSSVASYTANVRGPALILARMYQGVANSGVALPGAAAARVAQFLRDNDSDTCTLLEFSNRMAAPLCYWLDGKVYASAKRCSDALRTSKKRRDDYVRFQQDRSDAEFRLGESNPGQKYLGREVQTPDDFVERFILPDHFPGEKDSPEWKDYYELVEKLKGVISGGWTQLIPAWIRAGKPVDRLMEALEIHTNLQMPPPTITTTFIPPPPQAWKKGGDWKTIDVKHWELDAEERNELAEWFEASKLAVSVDLIFALISGGLSIAEAKELWHEDDERNYAILGALGATCESVKALLELRHMEAPAKILGLVGACLALATNGYHFLDDVNNGDYASAVGDGVAVIGSLLCMWGAQLAVDGAAEAATGIGAAPAVLTWIGSAMCFLGAGIALFLKHDDLDWCVGLGFFGESTKPVPLPPKPAWSPKPFEQWTVTKEGLEAQVEAARNLLAAFIVQAPGPEGTRVRVCTGMSGPDSYFTVVIRAEYKGGPGGTHVAKTTSFGYGCAKQDIISQTGDEVYEVPHMVVRGIDKKGRPFFDILYVPKLGYSDPAHQDSLFVRCDCTVWYSFDKEGKAVLPKAPLSFEVCNEKGEFGTEKSSKDAEE